MSRRKQKKIPRDDGDATSKLLCDEAANHMKVRNFAKAMTVYTQVIF